MKLNLEYLLIKNKEKKVKKRKIIWNKKEQIE